MGVRYEDCTQELESKWARQPSGVLAGADKAATIVSLCSCSVDDRSTAVLMSICTSTFLRAAQCHTGHASRQAMPRPASLIREWATPGLARGVEAADALGGLSGRGREHAPRLVSFQTLKCTSFFVTSPHTQAVNKFSLSNECARSLFLSLSPTGKNRSLGHVNSDHAL